MSEAGSAAATATKVDDSNVVLNVYIPLLITASSIIFYASKRSLDKKEMETMKREDAMMFPVVGSGVLFGLFLLFKFFAKEYLNILFTFYFLVLGIFSVAYTLLPFVQVRYHHKAMWLIVHDYDCCA
jgi:hypothetical protein